MQNLFIITKVILYIKKVFNLLNLVLNFLIKELLIDKLERLSKIILIWSGL